MSISAAAVLLLAGTILVSSFAVVRAEQDHLTGHKVRDYSKVKLSGSYTLSGGLGTQVCEPIKARFLLVQSEKNGGDDPRGGPAGRFLCYRASCSGTLPPNVPATGQFGAHSLKTISAQLLCVPAELGE
jgi:hypothetical protein